MPFAVDYGRGFRLSISAAPRVALLSVTKKGNAEMTIEGDALLHLVSGVGAKAPACFVLEAGGRRLMLDLGEGPPPGQRPIVDAFAPVDAVLLTHGHKDHIGSLDLLPKLGNPPVYCTDILASRLPKGLTTVSLPLVGRGEVLGIQVETGRNGHAPGGIWLHFSVGAGLLYTGDVSAESVLYAYDPPSTAAGTALIDCSYGCYQEPLAACWSELVPYVERSPILLPVPANGRGPELALEILRDGHTDIYVDDAMAKALRDLCEDAALSLRDAVGDDIKCLTVTAKPIDGMRGIMLAGSADGTSGTSKQLLEACEHEPEPTIIFTGYRAPGTPADRLIKTGRARSMRWNVHPRLSDTLALVEAVQAKTVIPAFCDKVQVADLAAALALARVTIEGPVRL